MTEVVKLTPTQFDVLDAVLEGKGPYERRRKDSNHPFGAWKRVRSMGGAAYRTVETLKEAGLLSSRDRDLPDNLPNELRDLGNQLTVKGLRALEAALAKKKFDPADGRLAKVRRMIVEREKFERELEDALAAHRDRAHDAFARRQAARRLAKAEVLRDLFRKEGLNFPSDDEMLAFAKKVEGADHSNRDVEFLDEADLSAELDSLEKEATTPGTFGDHRRGKRIAAIRAEFQRRAEAA